MGAKLTEAQEQCLRDQVITADLPGPVLHDFGMLLDFMGPKGVEAGGKYNLLPLKLIDELDSRLSHPLHLDMKRPQIRSHPYLQGLNLLLRASGLSRVEGTGAKARLVLDPAMMVQWDQLNPTERYFNLLEAWLRFGRAEMVGDQGPISGELLTSCLQTWKFLKTESHSFGSDKPQEVYLIGIGRSFYLLALMDLFGLMEVENPRPPITTWYPAGIKHVPFGDAVFTLLLSVSWFGRAWRQALSPVEAEDEPEEVEDVGEPEEGDEAPWKTPSFGEWQPLFQPYFPEWRENLEFEEEAREGTFVFRVSLGKIWRLIAIPADARLGDMVGLILRSVKFDFDHLYEFRFRDRRGAEVRAVHEYMDEGPWADQIPIGTLPLEPGQTMQLVYDFGDNWEFTIRLERIEPPGAKAQKARILESHGKAPDQYGSGD